MKAAIVLLSFFAVSLCEADETEKLLEELTNAHGVSGFEGPVRDILRREWKDLLTDLHTDGLGNLIGSLRGSSDSPRVLLMAHMDEVGFLVRHIDENGYLYIHNVGGYFDQSVLTQRLSILTARGEVLGYTGMKSGHILRPEERDRMIHLQDMFVDVGASSRAEAEGMGLRPGLPVAYATRFEVLNGTRRYLAKAWDDRVGLAVITEALRQLRSRPHANNLQVAATSPDIVINLEIGIASDFPLLTTKALSQEELGKGAGIFVFDGSMIPNHNYIEWILRLADENTIPVQFESVTGYGEDAAMIQKSARGVPAVNIGIPTRYGHSQSGVIDRADYDHTVALVVKMIERLAAADVASLREF